MLDAVGIVLALFYGGVLLWLAVGITRHLVRLVRPSRPAHFVALHMTSVWAASTAYQAFCVRPPDRISRRHAWNLPAGTFTSSLDFTVSTTGRRSGFVSEQVRTSTYLSSSSSKNLRVRHRKRSDQLS